MVALIQLNLPNAIPILSSSTSIAGNGISSSITDAIDSKRITFSLLTALTGVGSLSRSDRTEVNKIESSDLSGS